MTQMYLRRMQNSGLVQEMKRLLNLNRSKYGENVCSVTSVWYSVHDVEDSSSVFAHFAND